MKDLEKMELNISAYFKTNDAYIQGRMSERFKSADKITLKKTRFFAGFINSMANLYSRPFERDDDYPDELSSALNSAMQDADRYHAISQEALLYIRGENEITPMDPSEYVLYPSEVDYNIVFLKDKKKVLKYELNKPIMVKETTLQACQNYSASDEGSWTEHPEYKQQIKILPFVVIRHRRLSEPMFNNLVEMEADKICDISWGFYNAAPKLLTQPIVTTAESKSETQAKLDGFGNTSDVMVMGVNDKIDVINFGDLKNLESMLGAWKTILEEECLLNGADKNTIIPATADLSAEAKKVDLNYMNQVRAVRSTIFKTAEKDFINLYNQLFQKNFTFTSITYLDLVFGSESNENQKSDTNSSDM